MQRARHQVLNTASPLAELFHVRNCWAMVTQASFVFKDHCSLSLLLLAQAKRLTLDPTRSPPRTLRGAPLRYQSNPHLHERPPKAFPTKWGSPQPATNAVSLPLRLRSCVDRNALHGHDSESYQQMHNIPSGTG